VRAFREGPETAKTSWTPNGRTGNPSSDRRNASNSAGARRNVERRGGRGGRSRVTRAGGTVLTDARSGAGPSHAGIGQAAQGPPGRSAPPGWASPGAILRSCGSWRGGSERGVPRRGSVTSQRPSPVRYRHGCRRSTSDPEGPSSIPSGGEPAGSGRPRATVSAVRAYCPIGNTSHEQTVTRLCELSTPRLLSERYTMLPNMTGMARLTRPWGMRMVRGADTFTDKGGGTTEGEREQLG